MTNTEQKRRVADEMVLLFIGGLDRPLPRLATMLLARGALIAPYFSTWVYKSRGPSAFQCTGLGPLLTYPPPLPLPPSGEGTGTSN